jgi:hypothetical protein
MNSPAESQGKDASVQSPRLATLQRMFGRPVNLGGGKRQPVGQGRQIYIQPGGAESKVPRWVANGPLPEHFRVLFTMMAKVELEDDDAAINPQNVFLEALAPERRRQAEARLQTARARSRFLCFELVGELLFGKDWLKNMDHAADEFLVRQIALSEDVETNLHKAGRANDTQLRSKVGKLRRQIRERSAELKFSGGLLIDIARLWTNSLIPLWMMSHEAASQMIGYIHRDWRNALSADAYKKEIQRAGLSRHRYKYPPIVSVTFLTGDRFAGFGWRPGLKIG